MKGRLMKDISRQDIEEWPRIVDLCLNRHEDHLVFATGSFIGPGKTKISALFSEEFEGDQ